MRTKALLGLAVIAAGALTATAQTSVYSLNVVGYYNVTVPAKTGAVPGYAIVANQLVGTNYTVGYLMPSPAEGTQLLKWNGKSYDINNFTGGAWDDDTQTLGLGEAAFVANNTATPMTITFVGEVSQATNTVTIAKGYQMGGLFTPQAGGLTADFGYAPAENEQVLVWNGKSYDISAFSGGEWDGDPQVKVGQGFFWQTVTAHTWTRSFTVK
jgi:hypothetical protein